MTTIGTKEVIRGIQNGTVTKVIVAKNCPDYILERLKRAKHDIAIEVFPGDQKELATHFGKPFFAAVVGVQ